MNARFNPIASAVVALIFGLVVASPVNAQTCKAETDTNSVAPTSTSQIAGEGTTAGASPADNTVGDPDALFGPPKQDSNGTTKGGDYGDGGGTTYPSGMVLGLTYNADLVSGLTINGASLLNSVTYLPQTGTATGWQWGNGSHYGKSFDADGRVTNVTLGTVTRSYSYDAAGQVVREADTSASGSKQYSFGYDELGQLISYTSPSGNLTYTYDANGNRRSEGGTLAPGAYAYAAGTNRVNSGAGDTYQYNADGTASTAQSTAQYNIYRQLSQLTLPLTQAQYGYNALGQRDVAEIYKAVSCTPGGPTPQAVFAVQAQPQVGSTKCWQPSGTRRYVYDDQGRLLGEYDSMTGYSQETVWFNNQPVATVINGVTYYVNADNIGAPRSIVRASDNVEMWRWDSDPFGANPPSAPNPTAGTVIYNLRFPGQVAGVGLYYLNGARDYNAATGRYLEPDPSGLKGGVSRYGYALGNPISNFDPSGLVTLQIGFTGTWTLGFGGAQGGMGYALDSHGNFTDYAFAGGGPGAGLNEGFGISVQISNAPTIMDLAGTFLNTSISGGLLVGGTLDLFSGKGSAGDIIGGGFTLGEDTGVSGLVAATYTWLNKIQNPFKNGCP